MEDLDVNIDYELEKFSQKSNTLIGFSKPARENYLRFAKSREAHWTGNFRDLNASITRMATLADGGGITSEVVEEEIRRLCDNGKQDSDNNSITVIAEMLEAPIDLFDQPKPAASFLTSAA